MKEMVYSPEQMVNRQKEREVMWEQQKKECYVEKPLNTYKECWNDVNKWVAFDPHHSNHSWIIFDRFQNCHTSIVILHILYLPPNIGEW